MNWHSINYLQAGTPPQRAVHEVLCKNSLLDQLAAFDPVLVGTFPLDIAVPGSDLDIICEVHDVDHFLNVVFTKFGHYSSYESYRTTIGGVPSCIARFKVDEYEVEIFGQPVATRQQNGYRHMVVEARLLALCGPAFKEEIIRAKQAGIKTEPAFAALLRLPGDPYQSLLTVEGMTDETIKRKCERADKEITFTLPLPYDR